MPITLEQYNRVQLYLDGEMTEAQQQEFLSQLRNDPELQESCEFEKHLRKNARSIRHTDELVALSRQDQELTAADPERTAAVRVLIETAGREWREERRQRNIWIAAAACFVLIAGSLVLFLNTHHGKAAAGKELFAQFFQKDVVPEGNYPMLARAFKDYNNNDYSTIQHYDLANMPTLKGADDQREKILALGYYYRGVSYLLTDDPEKAAVSLQWVIDHPSSEDLVWKAQWYKSLALVRTSHTEEAKKLLRTLAANTHAGQYAQQANALLQKLEANAH
ncbi:MAG: hypothetical protein J0H74_29745 [Chitinophagaceae bacterium]|nr:hypothetical protein [Chitinophagaceae bacterium]